MAQSVHYIYINPASEEDVKAIHEYIIAEPAYTNFNSEEDLEPYCQSDGSIFLSSEELLLDDPTQSDLNMLFLSFISMHGAFEIQEDPSSNSILL